VQASIPRIFIVSQPQSTGPPPPLDHTNNIDTLSRLMKRGGQDTGAQRGRTRALRFAPYDHPQSRVTRSMSISGPARVTPNPLTQFTSRPSPADNLQVCRQFLDDDMLIFPIRRRLGRSPCPGGRSYKYRTPPAELEVVSLPQTPCCFPQTVYLESLSLRP
jgi:hypothetical protein